MDTKLVDDKKINLHKPSKRNFALDGIYTV